MRPDAAQPAFDGGSAKCVRKIDRKAFFGFDFQIARMSIGHKSHDRAQKARRFLRSEEHTSELQSLMRISYAVFCLKKKHIKHRNTKSLNYSTDSKHTIP